jgi:hypothetical protein
VCTWHDLFLHDAVSGVDSVSRNIQSNVSPAKAGVREQLSLRAMVGSPTQPM